MKSDRLYEKLSQVSFRPNKGNHYVQNHHGVPLKVEKSPICLKWIGDIYRHEPGSEIVKIEIASSNGTNFFKIKNIRLITNLDLPNQVMNLQKFSNNTYQ